MVVDEINMIQGNWRIGDIIYAMTLRLTDFSHCREDPTIPTRPAGQRPAPLRDPNMPHFFGGAMRGATYSTGNFAISAGFGAFPGLFGVTLVCITLTFVTI
jgi:hypothetical protein